MLVLNRRVGDEIWLGRDVRIVVIAVHGPKVRLGIEAPADLLVLRGELVDEVEQPRGSDGR